MYKPCVSLVNGEIISDLLDICNEYFISSGANRKCTYCGVAEQKSGSSAVHSADCPIMKYRDIAEKHKRFIVKK